MASVLVVDDEDDLAWMVSRTLHDDGHTVHVARDGAAALMLICQHRPDLCVLDVNMPCMDGFQLCHAIRSEPDLARLPVLFITGRVALDDLLRGFDEGGDDYLVKPFDLRELKVRVRALLRRANHTPHPEEAPQLQIGPLRLDLHTCKVRVGERESQLTPAEFELLKFLMQRPNQVFSSDLLLREVWGYNSETAESSLVRWHMMNLRAKIEPVPANPVFLCTVARHGYILRSPGA